MHICEQVKMIIFIFYCFIDNLTALKDIIIAKHSKQIIREQKLIKIYLRLEISLKISEQKHRIF